MKKIELFSKDRSTKDGLCWWCRECRSKERRRLRYKNIERERTKGRKRYADDPEIWKLRAKKWAKSNPGKARDSNEKWRKNNHEKLKAYRGCERYLQGHHERCKRYRENHPEIYLAWAENNKDKIRKIKRRYNEKQRNTVNGKINNSISALIRYSLRSNKNGKAWEIVVGYSLQMLKKHLEMQFKLGMTWENYGLKGWHIDHKIPISVFNFKTVDDIDFKKCWALENLQPMWAGENISKSNRLDKPFQPSLAFGCMC